MKKYRTRRRSTDPIFEMHKAAAERTKMNQELLISLAHAVAANEKAQRKFRNAVLLRLSRIDSLLVEIQGAQLVQFWPPEKVSDEKREELVREVEDRMSRASEELWLKMFKYIYGTPEKSEAPRDQRRKWSDWEI
ncbi:MAG: hypothetical protein JWM16_528 [Verrucomicrobiales bacterium]|nr:hypothetical protein [Verrucomicrobiales bacterium]